MRTTLLALVVTGCESSTPSEPGPEPVELAPIGEGQVLPPLLGADEGVRPRRRMDLDQLSASIQEVTGGSGWTELQGDQEVDVLVDVLGPTLGYPDYIERTSEDLSTSVLFQKFLGDAARQVCAGTIGRELALPGSTAVLMLHAGPDQLWDEDPDAIVANTSYLLLRFHGTRLEPGDPRLDPWLWLYRSTEHTSGTAAAAWNAVCVGLITHPDFYTY